MKHLKKFLKDLWQDEYGQGATEYILLATVLIVVVFAFRDRFKVMMEGLIDTDVTAKLKGAINRD